MGSLTYHYNKGTNQLAQVNDAVPATNYPNDIDNETSKCNYRYNKIGQLAKDSAGKLDTIIWNVYGKVQEIDFPPPVAGGFECIKFVYDPLGNRLEKIHYKSIPVYCYMCMSPPIVTADTTLYARDARPCRFGRAQGNLLALYTRNHDTVKLNEYDIYGSKRIGTLDTNMRVQPYTVVVPSPPLDSSRTYYLEGQRRYELTNHLGNVLVTVDDRKLPVDTTGTPNEADYYIANVVNAQDYYPFGMPMPGRGYVILGDSAYRFGFNDKLHDDDIYGKENSYDYGMRFYNPRLGRFLSIDPLTTKYPFYSPYQFAGNDVIRSIDLDGLEPLALFNTPDAAATDFGKLFNDNSIRDNREFGAKIYQQKDETGNTKYGYTIPVIGQPAGLTNSQMLTLAVPHGATVIAWTHTHGASTANAPVGQQYDDNHFSGKTGDIGWSQEHHWNGYVATPNGSLQKYDIKSGSIAILSTDMPKDSGPGTGVPGKSEPSTSLYSIKKGDTLYSLAKRYMTSVDAIKKENKLHSDKIITGKTLKITN